MFVDYVKQVSGKMVQANGAPVDVILSTIDRGNQIRKQEGNPQLNFPSVVIKRQDTIKPSDFFYTYKSFETGYEVYRRVNKDKSEKVGREVFDIVMLRPPTCITINYDVEFYSRTIVEANDFQQRLLSSLQRRIGTVQDDQILFYIFYDGPISEGNILEFSDDQKKVIVGATFRLEGFFVLEEDLQTFQSSPRTVIDVKESSVFGVTMDQIT